MAQAADTDLVRQRIDYVDLPGGAVKAILTVSLPGGITKRFESITTKDEAAQVEGEIVGAELMLRGPDVVGFNLFKSVGKLAKKVANSKVFKLAAKGLALAAPLLGPIAPAALAASAGMGIASKLAHAGVAAAKGAQSLAREITASAAGDARKLTTTAAGAAQLLAAANAKRLGAERVADKSSAPPARPAPPPPPRAAAPRPAPAPKATPAPRAPDCAPCATPSTPSYPPMSEGDLLARARAGRVRSNSNQLVDPGALIQAHREGRIYWVS